MEDHYRRRWRRRTVEENAFEIAGAEAGGVEERRGGGVELGDESACVVGLADAEGAGGEGEIDGLGEAGDVDVGLGVEGEGANEIAVDAAEEGGEEELGTGGGDFENEAVGGFGKGVGHDGLEDAGSGGEIARVGIAGDDGGTGGIDGDGGRVGAGGAVDVGGGEDGFGVGGELGDEEAGGGGAGCAGGVDVAGGVDGECVDGVVARGAEEGGGFDDGIDEKRKGGVVRGELELDGVAGKGEGGGDGGVRLGGGGAAMAKLEGGGGDEEVAIFDLESGGAREAHADEGGVGVGMEEEIVFEIGGGGVEDEVDAGVDVGVSDLFVVGDVRERLWSAEIVGTLGKEVAGDGGGPGGSGEFHLNAMAIGANEYGALRREEEGVAAAAGEEGGGGEFGKLALVDFEVSGEG